MSSNAELENQLREKILSQPDLILDDSAMMHALIEANDKAIGDNVFDLRSVAMQRLEARLDRLEDTHRTVIANAYENLAGTNQVHRAILSLLEPEDLELFLQHLNGEVKDILGVDAMHMVLETAPESKAPSVTHMSGVLRVVHPGFVCTYLDSRTGPRNRTVVLRHVVAPSGAIYGDGAGKIRSEACLKLDFGENRLPGLLVMGAKDPEKFTPQHGTDLLAFMAGVFERSFRRWLD